MRKRVSRPLAIILTVVLMLTAPGWALADSWVNLNYTPMTPPTAYNSAGISTYSFAQYETFRVDYNGYNEPASDAYVVGNSYPVDVFTQSQATALGYAAMSPSEYQASGGDVQGFLQGFQFLKDTGGAGDYLIDYDYLSSQAQPQDNGNGTSSFSNPSYILSDQQHDFPMNIDVTPDGNTYTGPTAPGGYDQNNVQCISNTSTGNNGQGFIGKAWFQATPADSNGNYLWKEATVSADTSGGTPGPVNLTQEQAEEYFKYNISNPGLSTNSQYPNQYYPRGTFHGECVVSFPYHVYISSLEPTSGNSSSQTASYTFTVTNQTPLSAKLNLRVYTLGNDTGKWVEQQEWDNITMPSVQRNIETGAMEQPAGSATDPNGDSFPCIASGDWSSISPTTTFTPPADKDGYRVVVTVDLNLNIAAAGYEGNLSAADLTYESLNGTYDSGGLSGLKPPGEPTYDTTEIGTEIGQPSYGQYAQDALNLSGPIQFGYNDHVMAYNASGSGGTPNPPAPPSPPAPPQTPGLSDLAATGLAAKDTAGNALDNGTWPDNGNSTQGILTFTFSSTFSEGGTATVCFYAQQADGSVSEVGGDGGAETVSIGANGTATVTSPTMLLYEGSEAYASVDAQISVNGTAVTVDSGSPFPEDNGNTVWETLPGNPASTGYVPAAYNDNYWADALGTTTTPVVPVSSDVHPTTYPIMDTVTTYQTETTPIYGWQEYNAPLPTTPPIGARLTGRPSDSEYDPNGWQTVITNILGQPKN